MPVDNTLRPHRKPLVLAAEQVVQHASQGEQLAKWNRAQLTHLIGLCGEAECGEEIENYLRYQSSRERPPWPKDVVHETIQGIQGVLSKLSCDAEKVAAWRLYAVYLSRAHRYWSEVARSSNQGKPQGKKS